MNESENSDPRTPVAKPSRRRSLPLRILCGAAAAAGTVLVLAALIISAVLWTLTPGRLTPLVSRIASQYLDADLHASRVELTWWSTFPRLILEIDSLTVDSRSLPALTQAQAAMLPDYPARLLTLPRLRGAVDLKALAGNKIRLHDVVIDRPEVTLIAINDTAANYLIIPPAEEDSLPKALPDIEIDRFEITGEAPLRYISLCDSVDVGLTLSNAGIDGSLTPLYTLAVAGAGSARIARVLDVARLPLGLDGRVRWSVSDPDRIGVEDMRLTAGDVCVALDATVMLGDSVRISPVTLRAERVSLTSLLALADTLGYGGAMPAMTTDLTLTLTARTGSDYTIGSAWLPDIYADLEIPDGTLTSGRLRLRRTGATISATLPSGDPDRLSVRVDRLMAQGDGVGFVVRGTVDAAGCVTDPKVDGTFRGGINLARIPAELAARMPAAVRGVLRGDARFRFRPSALSAFALDAVKVDGKLTLRDFDMVMRDSSARAMSGVAEMRFAANTVVHRGDREVDSMTTVSITVDTVSASGSGMRFVGRSLRAGLGARGIAGRRDTSSIIPVGIRVRGERAWLYSDSDSVRIRLRDFDSRLTLRRYNGQANRGRVDLNVSAARISYADRLNRAVLRGADVDLQLHPRQRPKLGKNALAIYDSISAACPYLSLDSVYALTLAEQRRRRTAGGARRQAVRNDSTTRIDFGIDNSLRRQLRLREASGRIRAARARAFTPYFPVTNRLDSVDIRFNTDSLIITDTRYRSGRTSVVVNGAISNITGALTSRRGSPLGLDLTLDFDTLDINTFAAAAFAGSSFASRQDTLRLSIADSESDADMQASVEQAAGGDTLAFVVPSNVRADLRLTAREVLYADIWFQRVTGRMAVDNGAIHLDRLGGFTDIGTMDLTALYSAPDIRHVDFAAGMVIRRLDLNKFLHMMPQVDSLLPLLEHIEGIITADVAMSTQLDSLMDIKFHTLQAAMKLQGDSLVVLDNKTFRKLSKWLVFKNKDRNMIDHMEVELFVRDSKIEFLPFQFDIDRYRLGVWGGNTLDMHYDYHVAVLKSPLPFKFGISVSGHDDDFHIRVGKANFNPSEIVSRRQLTDTTRINLVNEIREMFRFGVRTGQSERRIELSEIRAPRSEAEYATGDTLTHADSVLFMREGVIEMTPAVADSLARAGAELREWEEAHGEDGGDRRHKEKKDDRPSGHRDKEAIIRDENEPTTE